MTTPTKEYLDTVFKYYPSTGNLIWNIDHKNVKKGAHAGALKNPPGYRYVQIDNKSYPVSRIIMIMMTGTYSPIVYYKNGDPLDLTWDNLTTEMTARQREQQSARLIGRKLSEETKEKIRQKRIGKKHSEETKRKIGMKAAEREALKRVE